MTPLAQSLTNLLAAPKKRREVFDPASMLESMPSAHCFELTDVFHLITDMSQSFETLRHPDERLAFLPAPVTVFEFVDPRGAWSLQGAVPSRTGYLIRQDVTEHHADVFGIDSSGIVPLGRIGLLKNANITGLPRGNRVADDFDARHDDVAFTHLKSRIYAALAIINTPRIIGRRQHMPHAGLQRKLAAARGMVGKFPLQAWTEIILEVTPPVIDEGEPHEARLTGGKALHFCRSHLRVRRGQLELVKAHWRGDPALGIKRSRYSVVPPKNAA